MPRGGSGRLVIEVDPQMKRQLHGALATEGTTLKAWFITVATEYLSKHDHPRSASKAKKYSGEEVS